MSVPDLETRLQAGFKAVFPELSHEEIDRASPSSVGSWDSLATINLLSVLEEEFGIEIPADAIEEMSSYPLILDFLKRTVAGG